MGNKIKKKYLIVFGVALTLGFFAIIYNFSVLNKTEVANSVKPTMSTNSTIFQGFLKNVNYTDPDIFLSTGMETELTKEIKKLSKQFNDHKDISTIKEIVQWLHVNLEDGTNNVNLATAHDILIQKKIEKPSDYTLAFTSLARAKGIPTVFIQSVKTEDIEKKFNQFDSMKPLGNTYVEVFVYESWYLVDVYNGKLYFNYNNLEHSLNNNEYIYSKSLELTDTGITTDSDKLAKLKEIFKDFYVAGMYENPEYDSVDLLSNSIVNLEKKTVKSATIDNLTFEINYDIELLFIAAATGNGFSEDTYASLEHEINRNAKEYFSKYKDHPSAQKIAQYTENDSGRFSRNNEIAILINQNPNYIYGISKESDFFYLNEEIVNELKEFSEATNANQFFSDNAALYEKVLSEFTEKINIDYIQELESFFGQSKKKEQFIVMLSPAEVGGNALELAHINGGMLNVNIMNPTLGDINILNMIYHETAHNFLTQTLYFKRDLIDDYSLYGDALKSDPYFVYALNETLARAITYLMIAYYHDAEMADEILDFEISNGWINTKEIADLLDERYFSYRTLYKTFDDFLPVILEDLKEYSLNISEKPVQSLQQEEILPGEPYLIIIGSGKAGTQTRVALDKNFIQQYIYNYIETSEYSLEESGLSLNDIKSSIVIIAYIPGTEGYVGGLKQDVLGYDYKTLYTEVKDKGVYVDRFINGNQTTIVFGARDIRNLSELVKGYDFSDLVNE